MVKVKGQGQRFRSNSWRALVDIRVDDDADLFMVVFVSHKSLEQCRCVSHTFFPLELTLESNERICPGPSHL